MHINSSLPNLIGGVSQQPELLRLPSHMRLQENGYSSPSKGLGKRPASVHVANSTSLGGDASNTTLDFGPRGIFHLMLEASSGAIRVENNAGISLPLYDSAGGLIGTLPYLTGGTNSSLRVIKEADTVFIVNSAVATVDAITGPSRATWPALVWIKSGNYGKRYSIFIPGFPTATYETPTGATAGDVLLTSTDYIAEQLRTQLVAAAVPGVALAGSVITLTAGGFDGMTVTDGAGGASMTMAYKSVRSIAELPSRNAFDGFDIKVEGGDATGAGDHYLTYSAAEQVYKETRSPWESWARPHGPSMPHRMTPYAGGFRVEPAVWGARVVGDAKTNPSPSFIGKAINDLCFYQDRLCLLSGEGFDMSRVGEYFDFTRSTVLELLDSDPVSAAISHPKIATLRHAVPYNKRLIFFADTAQFELSSGDVLTPKTVATRRLTEFECSSMVRPAAMGTSLYFPVDKGAYSAFYNFFMSGLENLEDAAEITGHVPNYIPSGVTQMAVSPVNNLFVALCRDDPGNLYVYQFYQNGQTRLQSAWHKWPYATDGRILSIAMVGTKLVLRVTRTVGAASLTSIESIQFGDGDMSYRLDRKVTAYALASDVTGSGLLATTLLTLPYADPAGTYYAVAKTTTAAGVKAGSIYKLTRVSPTQYTARGNLTDCVLEVGKQYSHRTTLGRFLVREESGGGSSGISRGRTQVGRMSVNYAEAGNFAVEVATPGKPVRTYRASGRLLGTTSSRIGEAVVGDGRFTCPVLAENTQVDVTLVNDTPLPASFLSIDWEGYHVTRGRHV
jgi:hypothetical protein